LEKQSLFVLLSLLSTLHLEVYTLEQYKNHRWK